MEATYPNPVHPVIRTHPKFPEYQVRFTWAPNSIAFWDNRACRHYAVSDYWPNVRRVERVTIVGDTPYYDAAQAPTDVPPSPFSGHLRTWSSDG